MNLIDEAVIIEVFGIRMYAFGLYVAIGALCAVLVLAFMSYWLRLRKGTAELTAVLSGVCGLILSRLAFCLLNQELGSMTPFHIWPQISSGGWSMFGMIGGVFLGGWISARITRQEPGSILDILSLAVLPLIAAERIGENRIGLFDISRTLDSSFLKDTFLVVGKEGEYYLATYYLAAAVAVILFAVLIFLTFRKKKDGEPAICFLLLFGAASIITESLRYDFFLSISFVKLQQVAAALTLAAGVVMAIRRSGKLKSALAAAAIASLPLMVGAVIGLEFALDRTMWNKLLIYTGMVIAVAIPAALGMILLFRYSKNEGTEKA